MRNRGPRGEEQGRGELDVSTRRLAGEVAQLRRQVASETGRMSWSKLGHQCQYEVLQRIRGVFIMDLAKVLEVVFGSGADGPLGISAVIAAGEKLIAARERDIRMAENAGWLAVEKFSSDPLCANESEEKRWRKANKEAEEETVKKEEAVAAWRSRAALGGQGVFGAGGGGGFRAGGHGVGGYGGYGEGGGGGYGSGYGGGYGGCYRGGQAGGGQAGDGQGHGAWGYGAGGLGEQHGLGVGRGPVAGVPSYVIKEDDSVLEPTDGIVVLGNGVVDVLEVDGASLIMSDAPV